VRRDRDGSELPDDDQDQLVDVEQLRHILSCRDGWLGEDAAGRMLPCRVCRPHLERLRRRTRVQLYGPWAA